MSSRDYDRFEHESEREGDNLIKCAHCKGDGWNYTEFTCCAKGATRGKVRCCTCNGRGVVPA